MNSILVIVKNQSGRVLSKTYHYGTLTEIQPLVKQLLRKEMLVELFEMVPIHTHWADEIAEEKVAENV